MTSYAQTRIDAGKGRVFERGEEVTGLEDKELQQLKDTKAIGDTKPEGDDEPKPGQPGQPGQPSPEPAGLPGAQPLIPGSTPSQQPGREHPAVEQKRR